MIGPVRHRAAAHLSLASLLALSSWASDAATAQELTIMSGGAVKTGLVEVVPIYEKQHGAKVAVEFEPMGPLVKKLSDGANFDIAVITGDVLDDVRSKALIGPEAVTEVGRVGIGVAVHQAAPLPDIATPDALKATLLAAKSIVHIDSARGTSGRHFAPVLAQLGIADSIKAKTALGSGGYVVEPVGRGQIELGVHQITEILPVPGVKLVGPPPTALQKETVYLGAMTARTAKRTEAAAFLAFLRAPEVRKVFAAKGLNEPR
ncbi:MAG: ABC transporter substrate-binding protein [Alphaproteobacteria bacterium]|nr:ABC transporter substrate-binding protein [Alphaproteobacteria bacterium]